MIKYFEGDYLITTKNGQRHVFNLKSNEAKALYQKFMWIKIFNIKSIEPVTIESKLN